MSWNHQVLEAAIESTIKFQYVQDYEEYISNLKNKNRSFEVLSLKIDPKDSCLIAVIRKEYNSNEFKKSDNTDLIQYSYRKAKSRDREKEMQEFIDRLNDSKREREERTEKALNKMKEV